HKPAELLDPCSRLTGCPGPHDRGDRTCAPRFVRYAHDRSVAHVRMSKECSLDFLRGDVLAARDVQVVAAVNDVEKSILVQVPKVACDEPVVRIAWRISQVSGKD